MTDSLPRPPFDPAFTGSAGFPNPSKVLDVPALRQAMQALGIDSSSITTAHPQYTHLEVSCPGLANKTNPTQPSDPPVTLSIWHILPTSTPASTPATRTWPQGRPLVYFIHGGGQIAGTRFLGPHFVMTHFTPSENVVFASPEYRLAPEHPAPAAARDVYAGLLYLIAHAQELDIDPARIVVFGNSGGAGVAAGAALLSRSLGGPRTCALMLNIPMVDDRGAAEYVSARQFWDGTMWAGWQDEGAWKAILGHFEMGEGDLDGVRVPGRAASMAGLPPVFVDVGDCEAMRDQAVAFASRVWRDGGSAELHVWPGVYHGAAMLEQDVPVCREMMRAQRSFLSRALGLDAEAAGL